MGLPFIYQNLTPLKMANRSLTEDEIYETFLDIDSDLEISEDDQDIPITEEVSDSEINAPGTSQDHDSRTPNLDYTVNADCLSSWTSGPFIPIVHEFDDFVSGFDPSTLFSGNSSEVDFFEYFLNKEIVTKMVIETNRYYIATISKQEPSQKSRLRKWVDTSVEEMYIFFALLMLMTRNRHLTIEEHWSTDPLLASTIFGKTMSRDRYEIILRMLHFSNPDTQIPGDRLYKIKILIDHTRKLFKKTLIPYENLCIDESIIVFKGRLIFKQYIPSKRHRFGIKMFVLCDVKTGFILDFIIYCGEGTDITDSECLGVSGAVVTTLLQDYLNKGHNLFIDNWYSSPQLYDFLHTKKTNACGTVRKTRKGMAKFNKLKKGEMKAQHRGPLLALKWCDKREVHMLTTLHDDSMDMTGKVDWKTRQPIMKPKCVLDYNKCMGSVDKVDLMLSSINCLRKTIKWYKKVAFHIIDLYLLNSHIAFKSITNKNVSLADFQLAVIRQLLQKYHTTSQSEPHSRSSHDLPLRLTAKALAKHMPHPIKGNNSQKLHRACRVCAISKKRKMSQYKCPECDVTLCVWPCFRNYHEKQNL